MHHTLSMSVGRPCRGLYTWRVLELFGGGSASHMNRLGRFASPDMCKLFFFDFLLVDPQASAIMDTAWLAAQGSCLHTFGLRTS